MREEVNWGKDRRGSQGREGHLGPCAFLRRGHLFLGGTPLCTCSGEWLAPLGPAHLSREQQLFLQVGAWNTSADTHQPLSHHSPLHSDRGSSVETGPQLSSFKPLVVCGCQDQLCQPLRLCRALRWPSSL